MNPFLGEIQAFAFGFAPKGWAVCDGRLLPISGNSSLYALIGTFYGGNGTVNFALPNLVGQAAMGQGQGPGLPAYSIGEQVGETAVTLTSDQMPMHNHGMQLGAANATNPTPGPSAQSNVAINPGGNSFVAPPGNTAFAPTAIVAIGGSSSHTNMQPTLVMTYCIALEGDYPSFG